MPGPDQIVMLARYNAWQNRQMKSALDALGEPAVKKDRKAHFGSMLATVNHLLWADRIWMSRIAGWEAPSGSIAQSVTLTPTLSAWGAERFRTDSRLILWAERLHALDLQGPLIWYSGASGREMRKPLLYCVLHMFNHQTHHRGQVHAMVTAARGKGWTSDLAFMPEEGPWL